MWSHLNHRGRSDTITTTITTRAAPPPANHHHHIVHEPQLELAPLKKTGLTPFRASSRINKKWPTPQNCGWSHKKRGRSLSSAAPGVGIFRGLAVDRGSPPCFALGGCRYSLDPTLGCAMGRESHDCVLLPGAPVRTLHTRRCPAWWLDRRRPCDRRVSGCSLAGRQGSTATAGTAAC